MIKRAIVEVGLDMSCVGCRSSGGVEIFVV